MVMLKMSNKQLIPINFSFSCHISQKGNKADSLFFISINFIFFQSFYTFWTFEFWVLFNVLQLCYFSFMLSGEHGFFKPCLGFIFRLHKFFFSIWNLFWYIGYAHFSLLMIDVVCVVEVVVKVEVEVDVVIFHFSRIHHTSTFNLQTAINGRQVC